MLKRSIKYLSLLILLTFNSLVIANDELNLRLDIMSSIYKTSKKLESIDNDIANHQEIEALLKQEYKKVSRAIIISHFKVKDHKGIIGRIENSLKSVNYVALKKQYLKMIKRLQKFIRQRGINYISYVALTNLLQVTIPTMLMINDFNTTAVFAFYVLSDLPSYFYYRAGESYIYHRKMISIFGDKDKYIQYKNEQQRMRSFLKVDNDVIFHKTSDLTISIGQNSKLKNITDFLRITHKSSLSLVDIIEFAKENNAYDSIARFIKDTKHYDKNTKTLLLIHHLETSLLPNTLVKFKALLGSFSKKLYSNQNIEEVANASLRIQGATTKAELEKILIDIASLSHSKHQFFSIYQEVILPYLANHSKYLKLEDFRNLSNNIYKFKIDSNRVNDEVTSGTFRTRLKNYLQDSYRTKSSRCLNKIDKIFNKLLK